MMTFPNQNNFCITEQTKHKILNSYVTKQYMPKVISAISQ